MSALGVHYLDPTLLPSEQPMSSQWSDQHQCWIRWAPPNHVATISPPPETNLWSFETEVRFQERTNRWLIWVETGDLSGATWANNTHSLMLCTFTNFQFQKNLSQIELFWNFHPHICLPIVTGQSCNVSNLFSCHLVSNTSFLLAHLQTLLGYLYFHTFYLPWQLYTFPWSLTIWTHRVTFETEIIHLILAR